MIYCLLFLQNNHFVLITKLIVGLLVCWIYTSYYPNRNEADIFKYYDDKRLALLFWTPIPLNEKLFWGDLKNPKGALEYYSKLINKYDAPNKKFQLLYHSFLIRAGFNSNNYGFKNQKNAPGNANLPSSTSHASAVKSLIATMEKLITDEADPNYGQLVQVYYLWGVKKSGSKLFSGRVKVNKDSRLLFKKVIELTENNPNNIYRIFSEHWLNK